MNCNDQELSVKWEVMLKLVRYSPTRSTCYWSEILLNWWLMLDISTLLLVFQNTQLCYCFFNLLKASRTSTIVTEETWWSIKHHNWFGFRLQSGTSLREHKKLTSFVVGGKQYMFQRGFHSLCGLPIFFSRIMTIHFAEKIGKEQAITYIVDVILQAKTKTDMWKISECYLQRLRLSGLKAATKQNQILLEKNSNPWTHFCR